MVERARGTFVSEDAATTGATACEIQYHATGEWASFALLASGTWLIGVFSI